MLVTACGGHRRPPPGIQQEKLVIHIHHNGTKLFAYAVANGGPGGGPGDGPGMGGDRPPPGGGQPPGGESHGGDRRTGGDRGTRGKSGNDLTERLESKLASTGFCREGYIEMERYAYQQSQWIRGECREAASQQDWRRFGNRVSLY